MKFVYIHGYSPDSIYTVQNLKLIYSEENRCMCYRLLVEVIEGLIFVTEFKFEHGILYGYCPENF